VARKFWDMEFDDPLPAGGGGICFRLTKTNPISFWRQTHSRKSHRFSYPGPNRVEYNRSEITSF